MMGARTFLTLLTASVLLAGCGSSGGNGGSDEPVGVALLAPQQGSSADVGEQVRNAVQMVVDDRAGMLAGRPIKPVFVNSAAEIPATAYREAVDNPENNVIMGTFGWESEVGASVMDVVADLEMAHLAHLGSANQINQKWRADPEYYRVYSKGRPAPAKLSDSYVRAVQQSIESGAWTPDNMKFAIYGEDSRAGRSFGSEIKNQLQDAGWESVAIEYIDPDEGLDFSEAIGRIKDGDPSLLAGTFNSNAILNFVSQVRASFSDTEQPLIIAEGLGSNPNWFQTLGPRSNFVVDQSPKFATQAAQDFAQQYEARWGSTPTAGAAGLAYDYFRFALKVLETAKEEHGEITRQTVAEVHANQVLTGELQFSDGIVMNKYAWSEDSQPDPVVGAEAFIIPVVQYEGGQGTAVWPESMKTSPDAALRNP
jgi:branched-chain amino acid transport system substrate-binding protein